MNHAHILIVGGGVAGLACASVLEEANLDWHLFEAGDRVGGRVRTDQQDGFLLDRGFQVLLGAYPEARRQLDFAALELARFPAGAQVFCRGRWHRFSDPLREPADALASVMAPFASLTDLLRLARWKSRARRTSREQILALPEESTAAFLRRSGFSETIRHHFLQPFYRGILLDPHLSVSRRMLELTFKYFSEDAACLPAHGMEAVPRQLAARLPLNRIHLNSPLQSAAPGEIQLAGGKTLRAPYVVMATDAAATARLLGRPEQPAFHQTGCSYWRLPGDALPPRARYLHLCPADSPAAPINHVAFPSALQSSYAPDGYHLASVNTLAPPPAEEQLRESLRRLFGSRTDAWQPLASYAIPHALPARFPLEPPELDPVLQPGLLHAGDQAGLPSLDSALLTGRRAAEALLAGICPPVC